MLLRVFGHKYRGIANAAHPAKHVYPNTITGATEGSVFNDR